MRPVAQLKCRVRPMDHGASGPRANPPARANLRANRWDGLLSYQLCVSP